MLVADFMTANFYDVKSNPPTKKCQGMMLLYLDFTALFGLM